MGSYFVVLHSTPPESGDARKKFVVELAKQLGRNEQDIKVLLSELPAVVTASPTKDFAESLCQTIEDLGGLAEMMAEVSGVQAAMSGSSDKSKKSIANAFAAPALSLQSEEPAPQASPKSSAKPSPNSLTPATTLDLSFADEPAEKPKAAPASFVPPDIADIEQLLNDALTAPIRETAASQQPEPQPVELQPVELQPAAVAELSFPEPESANASSAANASAAGADGAKTAVAPASEPAAEPAAPPTKRPKSKNSLEVVSPFNGKNGTKKSQVGKAAKKAEGKKPEAADGAGKEIAESSSKVEVISESKVRLKAPDPLPANAEPVFEIASDAPPPEPKRTSRQQKILFGALGLLIGVYVVLLVKPDLVRSSDSGMTISIDNINKLLKQQDQIFKDLTPKPDKERDRVILSWLGDEISPFGSIQVSLGSTDGNFDSGTLALSTPAATPLTPEEYSRGVVPRVWIKDLVVEKLRKTGKPDELSGKAKITLADERMVDKLVAMSVVTLAKSAAPDVVTGTVEIFFPSVTQERPPGDVFTKDNDGQVRIYHKRTFSVRISPPEEKAEELKGKAALRKTKPIRTMPVV